MLTCCVDKTLKTVLILRNDYAGSIFRVLQPYFGSISTRVWKSYSPVLDWIGQIVPADSRELPSFVSIFRALVALGTMPSIPVFLVGDSSTNYTLTIGGVSGNIGYSGMTYHNGQQFSTYDADHDGWVGGNCARMYGGGFWFNNNGRIMVHT